MRAETYAAVAPLAGEWDDLADRAGATPWLRPGWIDAWWRAFGSGSLEIVALRDGARLAAVVPLARSGGSLRAPANYHTPDFGLLAEDDDAMLALAREVIGRASRSLTLRFVRPAGQGLAELERAARERGFRTGTRVIEHSPYVALEGPFERYLETLSRHHVKEVLRRKRRLEEQGELTFSIETGGDALDELLREGFAIEASGWKSENGTAIVSRPETERFYTEVCRWAAGRGILRLVFLRLDGRPLAFELDIEDGGEFYDLKGGYDTEFRKFGPGMIATYLALEQAFAGEGTVYDFLGSDEPYKLAWTSRTRERLELRAFARNAPGLAEWALQQHVRPLARRAVPLVKQLCSRIKR